MAEGPRRRVKALALALVVLFPLLFFGAIELVLRAANLYDPADEPDPFIGLLEGHRVFQRDPARDVYTIDADRARSFNVQTFAARKPANTFRIFCLGGSAAYGYPFGAPVAFSRWLADGCRTLWPGRRFEVVNAAGMSYGSHRIRALVSEIVEYDPDLVVIYSGHNEFIEKDFYIQSRAGRLVGLRGWLSRFHLYNLLKHAIRPAGGRGPRGASAFDEFGLHVTRRENLGWTEEERQVVLAKYAENMEAIARRLARRRLPLLLLAPAPNLADWRPEHSLVSPGLPEAALAEWSAAYARGVRLQSEGSLAAAAASYEQALAVDARYAELHYRLGQCWEGSGRYAEARDAYEAALDRDEVPIRIQTRQRAALRSIAAQARPLFADAWQGLAALAPHGLLGSELFWDYCHPNVRGHQQVAALACSALAHSGLLPPVQVPGPWQTGAAVQDWSDADLRRLGLAAPDSVDLVALPRAAIGLWWLGNAADRQGDRAAAVAWYERALQADPQHPASLIGLAVARSLQGDQEEAIALTQRALEIYERAGMAQMAVRARAELGVFFARAQRLEDAAREFREVLRRNPTQPLAHANLARALAGLDRPDEARQVLEEGARRLPDERGLQRELGHLYRRLGRPADAIRSYEAEARLSPGDPDLHRALAELYEESGQAAPAAAHCEACLRADPGNREIAARLARLYDELGRSDDARRIRAGGTP